MSNTDKALSSVSRWHLALVGLGLLVILTAVNWQIYSKEQHLAHGQRLLFKLAPVDPRSLMQGDYMALRFALADAVRAEIKSLQRQQVEGEASFDDALPSDGYIVVQLDEHQVAHFISLDLGQTLLDNQLRVQYRWRNHQVKLASNAFFFQEGHAKFYEEAEYGEFRLNAKGEPLLTAMYDEHLQLIQPVTNSQ
ncbi:GDYXXLXY domain-containing protein [Shewanella maritima]|uniref:GDYXXLXY domain-containing protein n=1 Tax=Shewanella maritima TaxID=2520507 RepID=UPI0037351D68